MNYIAIQKVGKNREYKKWEKTENTKSGKKQRIQKVEKNREYKKWRKTENTHLPYLYYVTDDVRKSDHDLRVSDHDPHHVSDHDPHHVSDHDLPLRDYARDYHGKQKCLSY